MITEVPSDVVKSSVSGAEKEFEKYGDKVKLMELKEAYTLGFQSGFQRGYEIYSGKSIDKKDIKEPMKYYHANFDRLH
jgi:ethanolamine ammonia-lyase large subunit